MGDIGLTVTTVERKLEELFDVASRWNAVLLFDEADVLLEQRTDQAHLKRNSIVSGRIALQRQLSFQTNAYSVFEDLGVL